MAELCVVVDDMARYAELELRYLLAIGVEQWAVHVLCHMEYDIAVGGVGVMVVAEPVAGVSMEFYIAHPLCAVYLDAGTDEVWSGIAVVYAWVEHVECATVGGGELAEGKNLVFPDVM